MNSTGVSSENTVSSLASFSGRVMEPVFGMGGAALWLDESLSPWKLIAAALVMAGLALNLLWPRLRAVLAGRH